MNTEMIAGGASFAPKRKSFDAEAIEAESDYSLLSNNEPVVPKKPTTEPKQATTPAIKPKAVMPKKQQ